MVREARRFHPGLDARVADFTALDLPVGALAGAVAFYAIVHLAPSALAATFAEWRRAIAPGGPLLVAFHVGDETRHVGDLWGVPVDLDFRFHPTAVVEAALEDSGSAVTERTVRGP